MRIIVRVRAGSRLNKIELLDAGYYSLHTTVKAIHGEANKAIIKMLADHFKVSQSSVRIVLGKTAKEKIIEISE